MPKDTQTLGNNKARACESLGFAHKKGCANILTQPHFIFISANKLFHTAKPIVSCIGTFGFAVQKP